MKEVFFLLVMSAACLGQDVRGTPAVPVTPATPTDFERRDTGTGTGVATGVRKVERQAKKVQYIAVSDSRVWTSADGRVVRAVLLAYEPGPVREDSSEPLTLVRDGKVRLLLETRKQLAEYALVKLSKEDQAYVKALVAAQERAVEPAQGEAEPNGK